MIEKPLKKIDYILFGIIAAVCFLTFQQGDIMHTAGCSYGYLQGHFLDFYDWDANAYNMWPSYMPSTYIVYAIWNIPMKLLGIVTQPERYASFWVIMWYKLLPVSLYMISGFLIYKIANVIGMGSKKAKICAYVFLTTPIGFFSQFMFGQYDILTIFLVLLGIYYYFKDNRKLFILFFALSIPFKYFSLLLFMPLLLLKEKNIWRILGSVVLVALPYAAELVLYIGSPVFREYVLGFGATSYVYNAYIDTGAAKLSLVIMAWGMICAWAYFKNLSTQTDLAQWAFYLCSLVIAVIFGLSQWHPQWLLFAVPFWVISAFLHRDTKIFMALDLLMMLIYIIFTVNTWPNHVDQELFSWGIFGDFIYKDIGSKLMMKDIFVITDMNMICSIFTALLFVTAIFKHPKYCLSNIATSVDHCMGWIRGRFLGGIAIFVIPAVLCFIVAAMPPYVSLNAYQDLSATNGLINSQISQVFTPKREVLEQIQFKIATYQRENKVELEVNLVEHETNKVIYSTAIDCSVLEDNEWVKINTGGLVIDPTIQYRIDFSCYGGSANNCISLYRTREKEEVEKEDKKAKADVSYAIIEGRPQNYDLCVKVFERNR